MVAFVGSSGCGKSTLLRLLLGFERPQSGSIAYDGQDLSTLDVRAVRQQLGVVLQESRVLPTDIFRNIVGATAHTMDDAWEAAGMAGLADDIREMPMGMHTIVSEGGGTFSGGQRQRLLIARALVNKPSLIFFDEATSALDNRAQAIVTQSMDQLDATRIVIAHRLSTIVNADRILYFDGGEVKEQGTYRETAREGRRVCRARQAADCLMPTPHEQDAFLRDTLRGFGASGDALDALLAYTANPFDTGRLDLSRVPLPDQPHIEAWEDYSRDSHREGVLPALARRLVQLKLPDRCRNRARPARIAPLLGAVCCQPAAARC